MRCVLCSVRGIIISLRKIKQAQQEAGENAQSHRIHRVQTDRYKHTTLRRRKWLGPLFDSTRAPAVDPPATLAVTLFAFKLLP